ncbi:MAG: hypothetical protein AAF802_24230 [Planctomycetota bacterium]
MFDWHHDYGGELFLVWLLARIAYSRAHGKLVPAVCWGLIALKDDDRLPADNASQSTKGE